MFSDAARRVPRVRPYRDILALIFWRFGRIGAGDAAVVVRIRRIAWGQDALVSAKSARWFERLKLHEVEVAVGPQKVGGSAVSLIVRQ